MVKKDFFMRKMAALEDSDNRLTAILGGFMTAIRELEELKDATQNQIKEIDDYSAELATVKGSLRQNQQRAETLISNFKNLIDEK